MKSVPQVQKYMTTVPFAISAESTLEEADAMMRKHKIRHLPVNKGNGYGVVSDRDLKYAMSLSGIDSRTTKVKDICEDQPYTTSPQALVSEVSAELADRKVGSVLVMDNGHLVGIFTTTDACRALSEICGSRFHS